MKFKEIDQEIDGIEEIDYTINFWAQKRIAHK
jgi:hypothetical protein